MKSRLILTGVGLVLFYLLFQSSPETATAIKLITGVKCPVVNNTPCASVDSMREEYRKLFMAYKRLKEKCTLLSSAVDTVFLTTTDTVLRREFAPISGINASLKPEFRTYKYIDFDSIAIQAPISKVGPQNQLYAFYGVSNADTPHYGVGYNRLVGNLTIGGYMAYQRSLGVFAGASVGIKF